MKNLTLIFFFFFIPYFSHAASHLQNVERLRENKDSLGLRIYLRKLMPQKISTPDWRKIRKIISLYPSVGYDVIFAWDRHGSSPKEVEGSLDSKINKLLKEADQLTEQKEFEKSFLKYQSAAQLMKKLYNGNIPVDNQMIYFNCLHQMARSLYGAKRFTDALTVYDWIPKSYPAYRQTLFEKMWAAFRANRHDIVIGSIYSQKSSYFSQFLEPESYLLKLYTLKKLCYNSEFEKTIQEIKHYLNLAKTNEMKLTEWARSDMHTLSLFYLLNTKPGAIPQFDLVRNTERSQEKLKIGSSLKSKFVVDKKRIYTDLEKVLGYAQLIKADGNSLGKVNQLPDPAILSEQGKEFWSNSDNEEWLDEVGSHYFIGESKCSTK